MLKRPGLRKDQAGTTEPIARALADVINRAPDWQAEIVPVEAKNGLTYYRADAMYTRGDANGEPYHIDSIEQWNAISRVIKIIHPVDGE